MTDDVILIKINAFILTKINKMFAFQLNSQILIRDDCNCDSFSEIAVFYSPNYVIFEKIKNWVFSFSETT